MLLKRIHPFDRCTSDVRRRKDFSSTIYNVLYNSKTNLSIVSSKSQASKGNLIKYITAISNQPIKIYG